MVFVSEAAGTEVWTRVSMLCRTGNGWLLSQPNWQTLCLDIGVQHCNAVR